jgi:hypothetical protein
MRRFKRGRYLKLSVNEHSDAVSLTLLKDWGWGGETRSSSDDFGDETDTTFVPCILLFSPKEAKAEQNPNRHVCLKNMNFHHPRLGENATGVIFSAP